MAIQIKRGRQPGCARVVLYGVEGIGKSTLASKFPKPLFLDTEDGSRHLDVDRVTCADWRTLQGAVVELAVEPQGYQTIVIDSIDWAERSLSDWVVKQAGKKSIEDFGFGKGYVVLAEHIARFTEQLDHLHHAGLHVVLLAHAKVQRTSPPDQTDGYDRYELRLSKQTAPIVKEWADAILFANYRMRLVEGSDGRKKAIGGKDRVIYTERSAAFDAKNRYQLPEELGMSIEALAPLFAGPPPEPELLDRIATSIAEAKSVKRLGTIGDRIDALSGEGKLDDLQVAELLGLINARHQQLEPQQETADA